MKAVKQFEIRQEPSSYLGVFKLSPDIWIILASISQLERDLIADRVKAGLANARAKEDMDDRLPAHCSRAGYLIRLYLQQYITLKGANHP